MKSEKEKIELEIKKLEDKRDNSSDTFTKIRLFSKIKNFKLLFIEILLKFLYYYFFNIN